MREGAAIEARLNATDRALNPAAGRRSILSWSDPVAAEIRDDQGICIKNPDTGLFMRYRLAGAYDSNIALLLTTGQDRVESWQRLVEVFRRATIRGHDLAHQSRLPLRAADLVSRARDPWAKPTTKLVVPYLTLVGELAQEARAIDLEHALGELLRRAAALGPGAAEATRKVLELKETLVARPLRMLFDEPHFLSAWLSEHRGDFELRAGRVAWLRNPVEVLAETYRLLNMDVRHAAAAHCIWDHDQELIDSARAFYAPLAAGLPKTPGWPELDAMLRGPTPACGLDAQTWERVRSAHAGHQLGLELLALLAMIADKTGFYDLALNPDLTIEIPARLLEPAHQDAMRKALVPPVATKEGEIVAAMGGTFYTQEAPHLPAFVTPGMHFDKGDPLYVIEVMKMFNKVYASFSGTVSEVLDPHRNRGAQGPASVQGRARRAVGRGGRRRAGQAPARKHRGLPVAAVSTPAPAVRASQRARTPQSVGSAVAPAFASSALRAMAAPTVAPTPPSTVAYTNTPPRITPSMSEEGNQSGGLLSKCSTASAAPPTIAARPMPIVPAMIMRPRPPGLTCLAATKPPMKDPRGPVRM